MLHTTFNLLRRAGACEEGYRKLAKSLGGVDQYGRDTPIPLAAVLDSNGLDDALWCLRATIEPSEGLSRDFACDCADSVASLLTDERSITAIAVARRHARGQATDSELSSAWDAARAAALAAWDAAWDAARDAARAAAWDAARAAALAAWDAAWDAARDAARAAMTDRFAARLAAHDLDTNPLGENPCVC